MFRTAVRTTLRRQAFAAPRATPPSVRNLSTGVSRSRSSLKGTLLRWGAAGGIVYYYYTSSVFADEPKFYAEEPTPMPTEFEKRPPSILDQYKSARDQKTLKHSDSEDRLVTASEAGATSKPPAREETGEKPANIGAAQSAGELEEEAGQEGAFNPETGEINWDCPCLGGMAHGPCGSEFREAFSCFVYSTADPKGVDCIEKFKGMQTCFQKYPEVYGSELDEDEEEIDAKLETLDPQNPEESPAINARASSSNYVAEAHAKPDTEPVDAPTPEHAVAGKNRGFEGIEADETKTPKE